jgi:hypothetical protein
MDPNDARNGTNDGLSNKRKRDDDSPSRSDNDEHLSAPGGDGQRIADHDEEEARSRDSKLNNNNNSESDESDEEEDDCSDYEEDFDSTKYDLAQTCLRIARNDAALVEVDRWAGLRDWNDPNLFLLGNALMGNTHLRTLCIDDTSSCFDKNGGIRALLQGIIQSQLHTLEMYCMSGAVQTSLFKHIRKLSTLRHFTALNTRLLEIRTWKPHKLLTSLTLHFCEVTDSDMMAFTKWIFGHSSLLYLDLSRNAITDIGVNCMCEHWKADSPLQDLKLRSNLINSTGARMLMREAARHSAFCKLDLSGNTTIGHHGLELIGKELPAIGFTTLDIYRCCDGFSTPTDATQDAVCRALADGLRGNSSLVRLDIGCNHLGANGARMLMQAMAVHPSLASLSLAYDRTIGLPGLKLIGMELAHIKLKQIDLESCAPGAFLGFLWSQSSACRSAGQALLDGVRLNETLTSFSLAELPPTWNDPIQFFMQLNATCRPLLQSDVVVPAVWPYILEHFGLNDKLSLLYWSLREQPWLLQQYLDGDEEAHVT